MNLKLRKEFKEETGTNWLNSQKEPDIEYVQWLEKRLEASPLETLVSGKYLVRAEKWYLEHQTHIDKRIHEAEKAYPPSDEYDVRNPNVWKPEHWKWFLKEYH